MRGLSHKQEDIMRYAVIDTGSNTIRLGVYEYENEKLRLLRNEAVFANLAGHIENNKLSGEGISVATSALLTLIKSAEKYNVSAKIFATAAIRNAENVNEIRTKIEEKTGHSLDILSGDEEAELSFYGAREDFPTPCGVMADVGGGSSEIIVFSDNKPLSKMSIPLGSLKAYKTFVSGNLPDFSEALKISDFVTENLKSNKDFTGVKSPHLCLAGGGVSAAKALCQAILGTSELTTFAINEIFKKSLNDPDDFEKLIKKIAPERTQTIAPALAIYSAIADFFGAEAISISEKGIKEGYVIKKMLKMS